MLQTVSSKLFGFICCIALLVVFILSSILFGLTDISWKTALEAFTRYNGSNEHVIIQTARVPRALIAAAVGASLAMAGAIMQALTRNPLASPGILGINAGAAFFIVAAATFFSISSIGSFVWIAFLGAGTAAVLVFFLGSVGREGLTPIKLTLAGAALAALLASLTQGLLAVNEKAAEEVLFWLTGSVEGRKLEYLWAVFPYLAAGWLVAFLLAKPINLLIMGEDVAKGLGQRTLLVKLLGLLTVTVLAGGSVAIAGPIGFIGLMIPHLARALVGIDYRWIIPYAGLLGAILLLSADILARFVIMPKEVPVGVMTAFIGVPFFIYIARRGGGQ
jgi:iron complex transport system permease protein